MTDRLKDALELIELAKLLSPEAEGIDLSEYCQKILTEHIKSRMG